MIRAIRPDDRPIETNLARIFVRIFGDDLEFIYKSDIYHPFIDGYICIGQSLIMEWMEVKIWLEQATGLERDALHIYCALGIQFFLALFFRKKLASLLPWVAALLAVLANEYIDMQGAGNDPEKIEYYRGESYHDIWNTMLLPTFLILVANYWPVWLIGRTSEISDFSEATSSESDA